MPVELFNPFQKVAGSGGRRRRGMVEQNAGQLASSCGFGLEEL